MIFDVTNMNKTIFLYNLESVNIKGKEIKEWRARKYRPCRPAGRRNTKMILSQGVF